MRKVDTLIIGGTVVTMNAKRDVFTPGAIAIVGSDIVAIGQADRISAIISAENVIDCSDQIIIPGLINAHTHAAMTLLRGLADDLRLDVWLLGYMMPVEREFVGPDFCDVGTRLACAEMLLSGITTFNDMYYFEEEVARSTADVGMRAILGQTILRFPAPDAASYDESLARCRAFAEAWVGHPLITPAVAPHAPYTSTDEILQAAVALALEFDIPLHIHLSETALEVQDAERDYGSPPIEYVHRQGLFDAKVIAAHCVHIRPREIPLLARHGVGVAHNPSSNLKLASGFAPVLQMRAAGVPVGIGTDGPASNNDLDMFEEVRLTSFLPKATSGDPTVLPAPDVFAMATIEGARALHMDTTIGSLEVGKRADIVSLDLSGAHSTPRFTLHADNVYSHLVYATKSSDVCNVWVHGRQLLSERQLLTVDLPAVQARAAQIAADINAFMLDRERSLLNKTVAIGSANAPFAQQETYEIQVKVLVEDAEAVEARLQSSDLEVVKQSVRQQFDTYFLFEGGDDGRYLRYREDNELIGSEEDGHPANLSVRPSYTLTLMEGLYEREYQDSVILSRSRYTAQATYSLRFYREYFNPDREYEVVKWRNRYRVKFGDADFAINIDRVTRPQGLGNFIEIKARTWSASDAEEKAQLTSQLLRKLGLSSRRDLRGDYLDMVSTALV